MNRAELFRAADLARAAADAATIAASFDRIKPDQANRYVRSCEEALYAALDALALAQMGQRSSPTFAVACEIVRAAQPKSMERAA